jgi:4-amino-4-deoxy-L-arabinose transferase-like glycosyltransferase
MKLLLLFLFSAMLMGFRAARQGPGRRGREIPAWQLLALSFVVGAAFMSLRVI